MLALGSNKSCYGHTEGAAGLTGMLLALGAQQQQMAAPIVGLREVNPYVASAVEDWRSRHGMAAALPRQPAPMPGSPASSASAAVAGTSSFGMSGVNAHMLLSPAPAGDAPLEPAAAVTALPWQRQRYWPAPAPHPLRLHVSLALAAAGLGGSTAQYSASFVGARSAFLRDHCISGRLLVPATCFFELLLAAAATQREDSLQRQLLPPGLAGVAIQAPKIMQPLAAEAEAGDTVLCTVHLTSGIADVASADGITHVRSSIAAAPLEPVSQQQSSTAAHANTIALRQVLAGRVAASSAPSSCGYNFAQLGGKCDGGTSGGNGWLAHPAVADAALHLSAVKVAGLTDAASRVPVAVATVLAMPSSGSATPGQQWAASQLPLVAADDSALCTIRAQLAGGTSFAAAGLHAKPLPGKRAGQAAADAAAEGKAFEQQNFTYEIEWQAAEAEGQDGSSSYYDQQLAVASISGLRLLTDSAAAAAAASGGLSAGLAAASQLSIVAAAKLLRGNPIAVVAGGVELLQRILAASGSSRAAVQALTSTAGHSASAAPGSSSTPPSAMLTALLKVAAVEVPERQWRTLALDQQQPLAPHSVLCQHAAAAGSADQHGAQLLARVLQQPKMQRQAM